MAVIHASQVEFFLTCLMAEGGRLDIVEIAVLNCPLATCPRMVISSGQEEALHG